MIVLDVLFYLVMAGVFVLLLWFVAFTIRLFVGTMKWLLLLNRHGIDPTGGQFWRARYAPSIWPFKKRR